MSDSLRISLAACDDVVDLLTWPVTLSMWMQKQG